MVPPGTSADYFRKVILAHFDMSLGSGLSQVADKVFRIGHLGDLNDLILMGPLPGVEMGREPSGVPYRRGGGQAALGYLYGQDQPWAEGAAYEKACETGRAEWR